MKFTKQEWSFYGIWAIVIIAILLLCATLFKGNSSDNSDLFKQIIAAKDEVIQAHKHEILKDSVVIAGKQEQSAIHKYNDSILARRFEDNKIVHSQIDKQYADIKKGIADLGNNRDSIRSAFARP